MTGKSIRLENVVGLLFGICLGIMVLALLAGCSDTPRWGSWSEAPSRERIQAVLRRLDTYIYFTNYEIYRHPGRDEYVFWDGRAWATTKQPPLEVSAELLAASPHVEVVLPDGPGRHHAEVAQSHPRVWQSPGPFVVANP